MLLYFSCFALMKDAAVRYLCLILFLLLCVACRPSDFELTMESHRAGDYDHAFKRFLALAGAEHAKAQAMAGLMYEQGQGVEQDFSKAAEQGVAGAQIRLAQLYVYVQQRGRGADRRGRGV